MCLLPSSNSPHFPLYDLFIFSLFFFTLLSFFNIFPLFFYILSFFVVSFFVLPVHFSSIFFCILFSFAPFFFFRSISYFLIWPHFSLVIQSLCLKNSRFLRPHSANRNNFGGSLVLFGIYIRHRRVWKQQLKNTVGRTRLKLYAFKQNLVNSVGL